MRIFKNDYYLEKIEVRLEREGCRDRDIIEERPEALDTVDRHDSPDFSDPLI